MHINYVNLKPIIDGTNDDNTPNITGCFITQCLHVNLGGSMPNKLRAKIS